MSSISWAQSGIDDFGITGLIDMPSARMQPDGTFSFTYARQDVADTFALTYQATPWLETAFRYHIQSPRDELWDYYDRSYEIKVRLWEETTYLPKVSVGVRDLLGTGIYSGEYLVGSKELGPFDFTLGLGWGRLAGRSVGDNPLGVLSDKFDSRSAETGQGGKVRWGDFLSGPKVGAFGGVRYKIPRWNMVLLAEYNSDSYPREVSQNNSIDLESPWSYGVNWEPTPDVTLGLSWQHGSEVALRLSTSLDSKTILPRRQEPLITTRAEIEEHLLGDADAPNWYNLLVIDARREGILLSSATMLSSSQVLLEIDNNYRPLHSDAAERMLMLAELQLPPEIEQITLVFNDNNLRPFSVQYQRRQWNRLADIPRSAQTIHDAMTILPAPAMNSTTYQTRDRTPISVFGDIQPRFNFFDPDNPARYQFYLRLGATANLGKGWQIRSSVSVNLYDNFDTITRLSNSVLPHVRSDIGFYLRQGTTGIQTLYVDKRGHLSRDIYYRSYAGILESMYAGAGGEILYRPFRSRLAVGVSAMHVWQRDYDRKFDFLDYDTTLGHLSFYWATPFYNYDLAVHFGRYLARDWGETIEIKRRFANGWEVGAFATFTSVSAEDFGEGSFDKGIVFRIPFTAFGTGSSRRNISTTLRSLTRDGGQWLPAYGSSLWDTLRSSNYDELTVPERW